MFQSAVYVNIARPASLKRALSTISFLGVVYWTGKWKLASADKITANLLADICVSTSHMRVGLVCP